MISRVLHPPRWLGLTALGVTLGAALALLFLLTIATSNQARFQEYFEWLLVANIGVTLTLGLMIAATGWRLLRRIRQGQFGSRLLFKLAAAFTLVGALPGLLIYVVSYQFVSRSIESWFDVQVEQALEAGLGLGRSTLQVLGRDLGDKTRVVAERMAAEPALKGDVLSLERLRSQLSARSVTLYSASGQMLASTGEAIGQGLLPDRPPASQFRAARQTLVHVAMEGLEDHPAGGPPVEARLSALAWIASAGFTLERQDHFLRVVRVIPAELVANALAVQSANSEYQQRALGRQGLRKMYIGTLTLTMILALFCAMLIAATIGQQLAQPMLVLAEGVREVAEGDLRPKAVFASRDELGGLTRSFASMTEQLADARSRLQLSLIELESARTHLQTILDNLTAGVIVFDASGQMDTVNPGAIRILKVPLDPSDSRRLGEVPGLTDFARVIEERFVSHAHEHDGSVPEDHWQESLQLQPSAEHGELTLLVRGASLPDGARLIVFDDISEVVSAQRSVAWAEVARRLAHEIKNPLTPIQLSAERLEHKLESRLEDPDRQLLTRSVATIVSQVQSMKQLVNEFRDYARLPAATLVPLDLNELVNEVLALYGNACETGLLSAELSPQLPAIQGDPTQLRQVIHNLVQNAMDAVASRPDGRVLVRTELIGGAESGSVSTRPVRLQIVDNGPGFADKVLKRAFEPYITTKPKGTGLGLAVVKKIADEHGARVRLQNLGGESTGIGGEFTGIGAQVSITFDRSGPASTALAASAGSHTQRRPSAQG
jgi:nitrogen fixation/metabolism regulation signal transduction histidine kinase